MDLLRAESCHILLEMFLKVISVVEVFVSDIESESCIIKDDFLHD